MILLLGEILACFYSNRMVGGVEIRTLEVGVFDGVAGTLREL